MDPIIPDAYILKDPIADRPMKDLPPFVNLELPDNLLFPK